MWRILIILLMLLGFPVSGADIHLAWDPSTEADLAGYRLHRGVQSRVYTDHVDVGNVTDYVWTIPDVGQYFAATAYNAGGLESGYSNEVQWSPAPQPIAAATGVNVSWNEIIAMAFPTTGILDDFSPDDAHPMAGWTDFVEGIDASGGVGLAPADSTSTWNTLYAADNIETYITLSVLPGNGQEIALYLVNSDDFSGYQLTLVAQSGNDGLYINKFTAGLTYDSTIFTFNTVAWGNGDAMGISIIGSEIKAYRKPAGGSWGQVGSTLTGMTEFSVDRLIVKISDTVGRIDDFGGGTVVAGIPIPVAMYHYMHH